MPYRRKDSPYWWIAWSEQGRRVSVSSGTADYRKAKALEHERRAKAARTRPGNHRTVAEVLLAYLEAKPNRRAAFAAKALSAHLGEQTAVQDIGPADVTAYKQSRGVADATLARELGVLSAAINHTNHELGWDLPNPAHRRLPRQPPGRDRWLTPAEAERLIAAASSGHLPTPYLADFIAVALHTGLRHGELLGLEWSRVDFSHDVLRLGVQHQKGRKHSAVPLNNTAREALLRRARYRAERCPDSPWVFTRDGRRIEDVRHSFATACQRASIEDFTVHDLRHTCATWLVQAGVHLRTVAEIMRHKSIQTTMRYAHHAPEDARAGVAILERSILRSTETATEGQRSPFLAKTATKTPATN